ncbi:MULTISPECIES: endonuclease/exonuclease/phosphatase family protein [unclassified Streptomyces]|uniref:endonuclease/exonuclease/phosphatase family protein n=1 Tax=unclassified Streptomyces TaxID=2593676 RepID=UPI00093BA071|nr:endonuclease/exonuclease/phosphatase family protein [Streptomyces sp. CB02058]
MVAGLTFGGTTPASATEVSADAEAVAKSAGQKWALKSARNGKYVSVEINATGKYEWKLNARSDTVGSWERFTLHTNHAATTISLRSEATGYFLTPEFDDADERNGMLRARGGNLDTWQQFKPTYLSGAPEGSQMVLLQSVATAYTDRYVTATDDGTLRSLSVVPGEPQKFILEPVGSGAALPTAAAAPDTDAVDVMTWNVCANNNDNCGWTSDRAGYVELNDQIRARLRSPVTGAYPDVIFFQEFCEKHAKRVEEMLESETGRGWDVRFAPIHQRYNGPLLQKQCAMGPAPDHLDRGAYGVALAVPDENVWYQRHDLTSPTDKGSHVEQRTALCAALPSRAVIACTAHLSAGLGYEDGDGKARTQQALELRDLADTPLWQAKGYRTVFGGDLNLVPPVPEATPAQGGPSEALKPLYERYVECAMPTADAPWTGPPTANAVDGKPTRKIDYIFAPRSAGQFSSCGVSATAGKSDHWTLYGSVRLPAA